MRARNYILAAIFVACGGAISSVDGNKDVGTLSKTDQDQLCHDVVNYVETSISNNDFKKFICGVSSGSTDPITCQANFQKCMDDPKRDINYSTMVNCDSFSQFVVNCKGVTVSQFTDCYKQYTDLLKTYASKMPVCDATARQQLALDLTNKISTQCVQMLIKCANTSTSGMTDAGVPDASPPDSGPIDSGVKMDGGGSPPPDGG